MPTELAKLVGMTTSRPTCTRCGRTLTATASVARGYGRGCQAKIRAAALVADHKPAQVAKAMELVADGGIVSIRGRRVFAVVSTSGTGRYLTAPQACNCAAGRKGHTVCYHRVAAQLLAA
ncbi:MAG: hypothetical protein JWQ81_8493 [Amycolatopsis sp.]|nr:hypothetical protein [Amycolatopsis sp.]